MTQKTTTIRAWGQSTQAYAEHDGTAIVVRVYDRTAKHYTVCHSLTPAQMRHVIGRTLKPRIGSQAAALTVLAA